jgi:hypothetical protein
VSQVWSNRTKVIGDDRCARQPARDS